MILLVDIGNSRTKYIFSDQLSSGKYKVVSNQQLTLNWLVNNFNNIEQVILANVSKNELTDIFELWAVQNNIAIKVIESEAERFGVKSFYSNAKQLGIDRWLAILGAAKLYANKNVLIVDAGTATTIDLLSGQGQHLGGWILPGINLMFDSLLTNTTKIEAERELKPSLVFGDNTSDNVNNACWAATVGAIELAIAKATNQLDNLDLVIVTGGNAVNIKALLVDKVTIEQKLIFHGLQRYKSN